MQNEQLVLEVSQVNSYIKEMLDTDGLLGSLCIRGELSNYKKYPSGHHYFTLKDGQSQLKCVMFRSSAMRLRFRPENGMMVQAAGRITVYPRDGVYQLYCVAMTPEGAGDLAVAFEQLKKKLAAEGLFDPAHKKPLPGLSSSDCHYYLGSRCGGPRYAADHPPPLSAGRGEAAAGTGSGRRSCGRKLRRRWTMPIAIRWRI